jgi:ribosomal protein S18 acetylase RimI-like enzyme
MPEPLARLRPATRDDEPFLWEMLREAASWRLAPDEPRPSPDELEAEPCLAHYVAGWGRAGDAGMVAEAGGHAVGACWLRSFTTEDHGWGFMDPEVPELSLAVAPEWRRRGIGTRLVNAVVELALEHGLSAVSLSVEPDNPARTIYLRVGFRKVAVNDGSWTMVRRFSPEPGSGS